MLTRGSLVFILDSSGAKSIKILSIKKKKNLLASKASVLDIVFGTVVDADVTHAKSAFKSKSRITAVMIAVSKKTNRLNGMFIRSSYNICMPIKVSRFISPVASPNQSAIMFSEVKSIKKYKIIASEKIRLF